MAAGRSAIKAIVYTFGANLGIAIGTAAAIYTRSTSL